MNIEAYIKRRTEIKKLIKISEGNTKISLEWFLKGFEEAYHCFMKVYYNTKLIKKRNSSLSPQTKTKSPRKNSSKSNLKLSTK